METSVRLPQFSMADNEATIVKWLKQVGEGVRSGEPIVEVETAKAIVALEAPESGVLKRILVAEGMNCKSGDVIAFIGG